MRLAIKSKSLSVSPSHSQSRDSLNFPSINFIPQQATSQIRFSSLDTKEHSPRILNFIQLGQPTHTVLHVNKKFGMVEQKFQNNPFMFQVKQKNQIKRQQSSQVSLSEEQKSYDKYKFQYKSSRSVYLYDPFTTKNALEYTQLQNVTEQIQKGFKGQQPQYTIRGMNDFYNKIKELDEVYVNNQPTNQKRQSLVKTEIVQNLNSNYQSKVVDEVDQNYTYNKRSVKRFITACKKSEYQQVTSLLFEDKNLINSRDYFNLTGLH